MNMLAVMLLAPLEVTIALGVIIFIAVPLCGALLNPIAHAGKKYFNYFFKSPGKLKIKILQVEIELRVAGIVFLFLALVIVLAVLYALLRMVPGNPK